MLSESTAQSGFFNVKSEFSLLEKLHGIGLRLETMHMPSRRFLRLNPLGSPEHLLCKCFEGLETEAEVQFFLKRVGQVIVKVSKQVEKYYCLTAKYIFRTICLVGKSTVAFIECNRTKKAQTFWVTKCLGESGF